MSDDNEPKVFLAKPPLNWAEMTEDEKLQWASKLSDRLKPST